MVDEKLLKAAVNAQNTIAAFYQWIDRIEAAGGATAISGVAECNAFLKSMKENRARLGKLVTEPLEEAIAQHKESA